MQLDTELRVTAALAELPPDYQEVIVLRNLQRLSFNEVAERMDRSRPAVQMLWMRAIRKLQEAWKKCWMLSASSGMCNDRWLISRRTMSDD